jgi:6-phosphogluconolactonase (cycloisomerase 2 family)
MFPKLKIIGSGIFLIVSLLIGCSNAPSGNTNEKTDTLPSKPQKEKAVIKPLRPYDSILFKDKFVIDAGSGTKSVLFNADMSRLYAMNLEGMSVYEFSRDSRKIMREFRFKPTPGTGWNYETDRPISSYQEKPVEGCISNNDSILWVSLHNAEGIVPIHLKDASKLSRKPVSPTDKLVFVIGADGKKKDSVYVPLITTGKTPKVIARTIDSRFILVSNWHSNSVSVLEVTSSYPFARVVSTIEVSSIPRGIVVDDKKGKTYVTIMGSSKLAIINNQQWTLEGYMEAEANPRHVVMDDQSRIFVSYNKIGKVGCIDATTGNTLFSASTPNQPRTIVLSKNFRFLFATCYTANKLAVLKVGDADFEPLETMEAPGHPVGVDIYENDDIMEVWVCAYEGGNITVYTYQKK